MTVVMSIEAVNVVLLSSATRSSPSACEMLPPGAYDSSNPP